LSVQHFYISSLGFEFDARKKKMVNLIEEFFANKNRFLNFVEILTFAVFSLILYARKKIISASERVIPYQDFFFL